MTLARDPDPCVIRRAEEMGMAETRKEERERRIGNWGVWVKRGGDAWMVSCRDLVEDPKEAVEDIVIE